MGNVLQPNKTKIARRVIEVFEFLDQHGQKATVMDIVRRYDRPQSSTSELLSSLVEMGLLYKDPRSRVYSPTPRLASLGTFNQPEFIREGRLFAYMDRLAQATRKSTILFGMVGTSVQIFRLSPGKEDAAYDVRCGASEQLSESAAGLLLLSTLPANQAARILWRLNAEAPENTKFNPGKIRDQIAVYRSQNHAVGKAGFFPGLQVAATLLPRLDTERPLAVGMFYTTDTAIDTKALIAKINRGISDLVARIEDETSARTAPFRMAG